jgi:hypothetical protein
MYSVLRSGFSDIYKAREFPEYLEALAAVYRAHQGGQGWCWTQSSEPREQSIQLITGHDGEPIAGGVQRCTAHDNAEISITFYDSDGCSATRVSVVDDVFHAGQVDYGPEVEVIQNVCWTYDEKEERVVILSGSNLSEDCSQDSINPLSGRS